MEANIPKLCLEQKSSLDAIELLQHVNRARIHRGCPGVYTAASEAAGLEKTGG